jgi:transposase
MPPVPAETARVARIAFPRGHWYLMMRDELGTLFTDADFAALVPTRGQPAAAPWRLALVTIRPYVEEVSDRPAAEAVRGRIDGKYALSLELTDPGFDRTVFSEFRTRVVVGSAEQRRLDAIRARCRERKWLKARGRQRPDSTPVLACVPSSASRVLGKHCGRPSTVWPWSPRSGSTRLARWSGGSARGGAWRLTAGPRGKRPVTPRLRVLEPRARPD